MLSKRITACIFTWNEEHRLAACIDDLREAFPLLIVDNASTDRTVAVAEGLGVRCITVRNPGFLETDEVIGPVERAIETPYMLIVSVSELIPKAVLSRYAEVAESGCADVVRVRRISFTDGRPIPVASRPGVAHPGELRFFRVGSVDFSGTVVHSWGRPREGARVIRLPDDLAFYHYRDYDCSCTERAISRYNDLLARQLYKQGRRFSHVRALVQALISFLRAYARMGCYRFGPKGFIESAYLAWGSYSVSLRLLEIEHDLGLQRVRERNDIIRQEHRLLLRRTYGGSGEVGT